MRFLAAGAIVAMVALAGCFGEDERRGSAQEGGTASVALGDAPVVLDPALAGSPASPAPLWLVYTPPLTYRRAEGREGTELVPGVARALPALSADGTTYSLRVRPGLRFSNGRPVRARDVRHSILRAAALGAAGRRLFAGVTGIEAHDRSGAVHIHLRRPDPSFPHALAAAEAGVVPATTPARGASRTPPPGVGPYRIGRSSRRGFVLLRNRDFRLPGVPAGLIDAFRLRRAGTPSEQAQAVTAGRLDVMTDPPPVGLLPELRSELSERYLEVPDLATRYLSIRAGREPLQQRELRRAVAYGVDKPEAARRLAGLAQPTCSLLPPSLPGHEEPDPCPWGDPDEHPDLERARELVEEAGEEGTLVTVAASPRDRPIARLYVETLRKIGLRPVLLSGGRADVTVSLARALVADPARFLVPLARRVPPAKDARALVLADELASAIDPDDAARLAEELDRRLVESGVLIPFAGVSRTLFLSARIDAANCARVHPVYGVDLSSLCVR